MFSGVGIYGDEAEVRRADAGDEAARLPGHVHPRGQAAGGAGLGPAGVQIWPHADTGGHGRGREGIRLVSIIGTLIHDNIYGLHFRC